jgi:plasmid replication initiation protein
MPASRSERRTRTYLTIDYDTKDLAKRFGARWDPSRKSWYDLGDVPPVLMGYVSGEHVSQSKEKPEAERQKDKARTIAARPKPLLREPPPGDAQADFFVPGVWDVATKDNRGIMDVAVFRLSKKHPRANEVMIHKLPDGHVRVTSGPDGMASIWDYDIVLMGVSHLTEAMNRYRAGMGERPGRTFRPHVSEILKFCRQSDGGRQYEGVEAALRRLKQTSVEIVRRKKGRDGRAQRVTEGAGLINDYKAVSYEDSGRIASVEIELPKWLYEAVVEAEHPEVLTMHPDYFLMTPGLGRFVYRLARQAAGRSEARWSFRLIYERSGSQGAFKRCTFELRELIRANDLPEYELSEDAGQDGPMLVMRHREASRALSANGSGS